MTTRKGFLVTAPSLAPGISDGPECALCPSLVGGVIENGCTFLSHQRRLHSSDEAEPHF